MKEKEMMNGSEILFKSILTKSSFIYSVMNHMEFDDFYERIIEHRYDDPDKEDEMKGVVEILWEMDDDFIYDVFFSSWDNYRIFEWYFDSEEGPMGIWDYMLYDYSVEKCLERFMETGEYKSAVRDRKINELGL